MKATGKRLNKKCFKATDMGSDYSSGAHRSLLKYGDSMPLNPNLLPFLGILRVRKVAFEPSTQPPEYIAHYRILRRLGKGGMGEVFLAEDTKQHRRKVALKVLPPELTRSESRLRRFKQEARAVLVLNHPNILTVFEIGEADGLALFLHPPIVPRPGPLARHRPLRL